VFSYFVPFFLFSLGFSDRIMRSQRGGEEILLLFFPPFLSSFLFGRGCKIGWVGEKGS